MDWNDYMRVLLSIITSAYYAASVLPPNPVLKTSARAKLNGVLENTHDAGQGLCIILLLWSIFMGIADISVILTRDAPPSLLSKLVQATFIFKGGDQTRMYLTPLQVAGALIAVGGGIIRLWAFRTLGKYYTFQVGIQKSQRLVTHGPYSIIRHPGYTGLLFVTTGFVLWNFAPGSWVMESGLLNTTLGACVTYVLASVAVWMAYVVCINRPPQEDKVLKQAFGKEWDDWARNVPYRTLPRIY